MDKDATVGDFLVQIGANNIKRGDVTVVEKNKKLLELDPNIVYSIYD